MIEIKEEVKITWVGNKIRLVGATVKGVLEIDSAQMRAVYSGRRGKGMLYAEVEEPVPEIELPVVPVVEAKG